MYCWPVVGIPSSGFQLQSPFRSHRIAQHHGRTPQYECIIFFGWCVYHLDRRQKHYLELFVLPCALQNRKPINLCKAGISPSLFYAVPSTYSNVFNYVCVSEIYGALVTYMGLRYCCWFVGCTSWRFRAYEIKELSREPSRKQEAPGWSAQLPSDRKLEVLVGQEATSSNRVELRHLWLRIRFQSEFTAIDRTLRV